MKKIISVLCALALVSAAAFAQKVEKKGDKEQWREKARAEQVALITEELNLTEAEAQAFWPVYNEVQAPTCWTPTCRPRKNARRWTPRPSSATRRCFPMKK